MKRSNTTRVTALSLSLAAGTLLWNAETSVAQIGEPRPTQVIFPHLQPRRPYQAAVTVSEVKAHVVIANQVSTTTIEMTLTNPASYPQEAEVLLPVPDGAAVRALQYDGTGPEPTAQVLRKEDARRIYEDIVRSMKDPAIMEYAGSNAIKTSAFPIPAGKSQKLTITYEQALRADANRVDFAIPRSESGTASGAWKITGLIKGDVPVSTIYSPSHELVTERVSDREVSFRVVKNESDDRGTFLLSYITQPANQNEPSFTVFTYPDENGGYFMILG
ncbi:MAG: VIT domain-containing protein, partial [Phycisphaerales bacterium]